jgi:hypothetical protein
MCLTQQEPNQDRRQPAWAAPTTTKPAFLTRPLPAGLRADSGLSGALDVRLDSRATQQQIRTTLRGARQFPACGA